MGKSVRAFITGWPVDHSRSPLVHGFWLEKHDLSGEYVKHPCSPSDFEFFLNNLTAEGFVGGNVTIPHKEAAFQFVDVLHPSAKALGAVNTIWLENSKLHGDNSDGYGFLANLDEQAPGWDGEGKQNRGALVLGAGGAARAIIYSLQQRGFDPIFIANRTEERAEFLAKKFGSPCHAANIKELPEQALSVSLIVNTTSFGMGDNKNAAVDLSSFAKDAIVNDIVYTPLITPLLQQAQQLEMHPVDGLGMLLHQAVPGFERWFGVRPDVGPELREVLLKDLGETS